MNTLNRLFVASSCSFARSLRTMARDVMPYAPSVMVLPARKCSARRAARRKNQSLAVSARSARRGDRPQCGAACTPPAASAEGKPG